MVESVEVAVPSGLLVNATHGRGRYSLESFTGTEGQLGIVTGLTFPLKSRPELCVHYVTNPKDIESAAHLLRDLASMDHPPLGIRLVSGKFPALLGDTRRSVGKHGPLLAVLFEGPQGDAARFDDVLRQVAGRSGTDIVRSGEARDFFEIQSTDLASRAGKAMVRSGEILIGLDRLTGFLATVERASRGEVLVDTQVVDRGLAMVMISYFADRSGLPEVVRDVPATVRTSLAAIGFGGRPYGLGIWNCPFAKKALGGRLKALRVIKNETDRLKILNPGKFFSLTTRSGLPVGEWAYRFGLRIFGRSLRKEV
jgi:glycolate oxidase